MTAHDPNEKTIFQVASGLDQPELRRAYLDQVCGDDASLRGRVLQLLQMHEEEPDFLDDSPVCAVAADEDFAHPIGSQIGPYKLREQIGEGGMGVVYVAEQVEPVRRKVALKIIKPGMARRDVVARFEAERQALAMMEHPNIARVFGGGATESGQPYFVMELVQGLPITEYCDQHRLSTADRLQLFATVCKAVQHAHQKGIIHRDLKPSNVLVPRVDGAAVPKVIDFGVAKAVSQKLTEQTLYTQFSQLVGTPLYMSPEQAELGVIDIDTRSDVYSLGVLLYELLTGSTPFTSEALKQAGFDEMRRIIREDEPPRPSAMVSTLKADALSTVSERRSSDPRKLSDSLQGELDWLVMNALEKDRNRRYESASALADDIQRYLSDEPITARPASRWYRVKKFAQRNRGLVASAAAILVALLTGLTAATAGFLQAEQSILQAEQLLGKMTAEQEDNRVLISLLSDMYPRPWGMRTLGKQRTVYESMEELSEGLEERLRDHPRVEIEVRQIFGDSYLAAGEFDKFRAQMNQALALAVQQYGEQSETVADIHAALADEVGWNHSPAFDVELTLDHADRAIAIYNALGSDSIGANFDSTESNGAVRAWFARGNSLLPFPDRQAEAEAAQRKCVELDGRGPIGLWDLGLVIMNQGEARWDDALDCFDEALQLCRQSPDRPDIEATVLAWRARCLRRQLDAEGAKESLQRAWDLYQDPSLRNEPRGHRIGLDLAELRLVTGDVDGAFALVQKVRELAVEFELAESRINCEHLEGWLHYQLEDYQAAERAFDSALQLAEELDDPMHQSFLWASHYLALTQEALGYGDEARDQHRRMLPLTEQIVAAPYAIDSAYWGRAHELVATSVGEDDPQLDEAQAIAEKGLKTVRAWPRPWEEAQFLLEIARVQHRRGETDQAVQTLQGALENQYAQEPRATLYSIRNDVPTERRELEGLLAELLAERGDIESAKDVLSQAVQHRKDHLDPNHVQIALAQLRYGDFLLSQLAYAEAAAQLQGAYERLGPHSNQVDAIRRRTVANLVAAYGQLGDAAETEKWRSELERLKDAEKLSPDTEQPSALQPSNDRPTSNESAPSNPSP